MRGVEGLPEHELFSDGRSQARPEDVRELERLKRRLTGLGLEGTVFSTRELPRLIGESSQSWTMRLNLLWHAGYVRKFAHVPEHWKYKRPTGVRWWIWDEKRN